MQRPKALRCHQALFRGCRSRGCRWRPYLRAPNPSTGRLLLWQLQSNPETGQFQDSNLLWNRSLLCVKNVNDNSDDECLATKQFLAKRREGKRKGVQCFFSFVLLNGRGHRRDFHKLLANWTCNPDVTASRVARPIKNFPLEKDSSPQDLRYVLLKLHVMLTVLGFFSFLAHMYGWIGPRKTHPTGIPC